MTFCRAPFTGITIDPAGNLNMCCSTANRKQFNTKISDIEDLSKFFLDTQMSELRQRMESRGLEKLPECKFVIVTSVQSGERLKSICPKSFKQMQSLRLLRLRTSIKY